MIRLLIIATILLAGPALAAPSTWLQEQTRNMHPIAGPFVSNDYGFSIKPPPGATEYVTDGGDANHGPLIILGDGRDIVVYPEYTGFVPGDATPCQPSQFPWKAVGTTTMGTGELNGHKACMVTFMHGQDVWRMMQTTGNDRGTGIMYTLLLSTTPRWMNADFLSFQRVADSFRRVPIFP
jgi:hypothetical protein